MPPRGVAGWGACCSATSSRARAFADVAVRPSRCARPTRRPARCPPSHDDPLPPPVPAPIVRRNRMSRNKDDVNLSRLSQKHRELDERLAVLAGRRFLTETEQFEESTLKKLKLKVKDEIESLLASRPDRAGRHG